MSWIGMEQYIQEAIVAYIDDHEAKSGGYFSYMPKNYAV
jgi:hypothetical protein